MIKIKTNFVIAAIFTVFYFVVTSMTTKYSMEQLAAYSFVFLVINFAINCLIDVVFHLFKNK